jgi:hypothetical protein
LYSALSLRQIGPERSPRPQVSCAPLHGVCPFHLQSNGGEILALFEQAREMRILFQRPLARSN